ncbi:MAG: thermonuclease family protein [Chloroflexi bacterium]|nr:thermonuclease family protein [Chloroflexota bacterium]
MQHGKRATLFSFAPLLIVPLALGTVQLIASVSTISPTELAAQPKVEAMVTRVLDGGTIEVNIKGTTFQVVYAGIEIPRPTEEGTATADFLAPKAAALNATLVEGQKVTLERDVTNVDSQGRLVRWVWVGDRLVNEALVLEGLVFANAMPPDLLYDAKLYRAVNLARKDYKGMWVQDPNDCLICIYGKDGEIIGYY